MEVRSDGGWHFSAAPGECWEVVLDGEHLPMSTAERLNCLNGSARARHSGDDGQVGPNRLGADTTFVSISALFGGRVDHQLHLTVGHEVNNVGSLTGGDLGNGRRLTVCPRLLGTEFTSFLIKEGLK